MLLFGPISLKVSIHLKLNHLPGVWLPLACWEKQMPPLESIFNVKIWKEDEKKKRKKFSAEQ